MKIITSGQTRDVLILNMVKLGTKNPFHLIITSQFIDLSTS